MPNAVLGVPIYRTVKIGCISENQWVAVNLYNLWWLFFIFFFLGPPLSISMPAKVNIFSIMGLSESWKCNVDIAWSYSYCQKRYQSFFQRKVCEVFLISAEAKSLINLPWNFQLDMYINEPPASPNWGCVVVIDGWLYVTTKIQLLLL